MLRIPRGLTRCRTSWRRSVIICHYLLKLSSVRFLLADDAGAGKPVHEKLFVMELAQVYRIRILAVFGIMRANAVWR